MAESGPLRVVLVDDHEDSREIAATFLRLEGYEVDEADTAESAMATLGGALPCVIVTDLGLGGMSGKELASVLRKDPRTAGIPVVAYTGQSAVQDPDRLFARILVKPVSPEDLVAAVAAACARF